MQTTEIIAYFLTILSALAFGLAQNWIMVIAMLAVMAFGLFIQPRLKQIF